MLTSPFPAREGRRVAYRVFGSVATAPRRARAFVRCQLRGWQLGHLADTAELVVSELVTNAVRATDAVVSPPVASSMFPVALRTVALRVREAPGPRSLFIEVWDGSEHEPVPGGDAGGEPGESGRGLVLVGSLARRWGHYTAPDRGKIVWCELAIAAADAVAFGLPEDTPPAVVRGPSSGMFSAVVAGLASGVSSALAPVAGPAGALPRRERRHPVGVLADGPDEATLLRVLEGLRALDVSGPDHR
ncbi:ATP-binding protein [Microbispora sp. H10949]|uniref:ATP-binding protein n=1 Tax=Microbispora sp. H10949 TaxID=2729111 RepID=UPI001603D57F|nr:ATP-binding protein [Microbispora sp. H10949]